MILSRLAVLAGLALAPAAQAATVPSPLAAAVFLRGDLPAQRISIAPAIAQANSLRAAGIAKTSLDARFARPELSGAVGFLCGLQPRRDETIATAHGYDPQGRFLGAKLSLAFR